MSILIQHSETMTSWNTVLYEWEYLSKSIYSFRQDLKDSSGHISDQCLHIGKGGLDPNLLISLQSYPKFVLPSAILLHIHVEKLPCPPKTTSLPSFGEFCFGNLQTGLLRFTKYCADTGIIVDKMNTNFYWTLTKVNLIYDSL